MWSFWASVENEEILTSKRNHFKFNFVTIIHLSNNFIFPSIYVLYPNFLSKVILNCKKATSSPSPEEGNDIYCRNILTFGLDRGWACINHIILHLHKLLEPPYGWSLLTVRSFVRLEKAKISVTVLFTPCHLQASTTKLWSLMRFYIWDYSDRKFLTISQGEVMG